MINKAKNIALILTLGITFLLASSVASAYTIDPSFAPDNAPYAINYDHLNQGTSESAATATILILQVFAGALLYFAAPVATILIIVNAFRMVTGGAESESLDQSKKGLTWTVIGLVVIMMSYSIVRISIDLSLRASNTDDIKTETSTTDGGGDAAAAG